jgi:hypothetical protein
LNILVKIRRIQHDSGWIVIRKESNAHANKARELNRELKQGSYAG